VELEFSLNRLSDASVSISEANRLFGIPIWRKYIQRLAVLRATEKFTQLYGHRALRLHPLKGNRAGQFSMALTGNYRLVIEKVQEDKVRITDVEDYHGD
jgi:plasmid maintenance system killer protein